LEWERSSSVEVEVVCWSRELALRFLRWLLLDEDSRRRWWRSPDIFLFYFRVGRVAMWIWFGWNVTVE